MFIKLRIILVIAAALSCCLRHRVARATSVFFMTDRVDAKVRRK